MANTLMFEVGVSMAKDGLAQVKKELDQFVSDYSKKMQIQIEIKNLQTLVDSLRSIGSGDQLKPLLEQIERMQQRLGAMSDKGQYFDMLHREAAAAAKAVEMAQERLDKVKKTNNVNLISNANQQLQEAQKEAAGVNAALANATARFAEEEKKAAATTTDTKAKIDALAQSVADLHTKMGGNMKVDLGGDFKKWATEAQAVTTSVKELVEQLQKMHTATATAANSGTTNGGIFDQQKFTSLQEAIDKIIREINRLQEAFTKLGENSSLSNLSATIKGLAVELSNLTTSIKLQPIDEQVKALLNRAETAENKLRAVGDAAKYLNERAGERTQQKASNIAGIAGIDEERVNKATNAVERFFRVLYEAENYSAKIGKIQNIAETWGIDPVILRKAQTQLEGLIKTLRNGVTYDEKKTPIMHLSSDEITKLTTALSAFKSQYKDIIKEADRFNKANERDSLKQKSEALRASASNMKAAENEARKLTVTISNLEAFANKADVIGIDTAKLRAQIADLKIYKQTLDNIAGGRDRQSVKKFVTADWFLETKREIKDATSAIKKEMSNALKPDNEGVNALKEYVSLLRQITSLTKTANRAESLGIDVQTLRNQIQLLEHYAKIIDQFARNNGKGFNAWMQGTPVYGEARLNIAGDQAKINKEITDKKNENRMATLQLSESEQRLANAVTGASDSMRGQSQVLSDLKMMAMQYLSVWGAQNFVHNIIETGGLLEQQRLSLSAILGDMGKAQTLFNQIKTMALKSPFGVVELDKMSKQLAAYSFEYEELFEWTKRLADISAATGTSVDRLALALGHVRSEGALSGYTLRQFAMANVPVLRMLSENLGISSKEVRDRVRKKEISAEDVQGILRQLTDDGGMFANAQETMSEALNAKFKNLRDAFDIMYGEIAESGIGDKLKDLATTLTNGAKHWQRLATDIKDVALSFGVVKLAIFMYNNALGKGTAVTLKNALAAKEQEVANLRLTSSYRKLTVEEEFNISTAGKLNSRNIALLLSTDKLKLAELERAVALGKVDKAAALAAMRLLNLNTTQMQSVVVLKGWSKAWAILRYNITLAGVAIKSFLASAWPLLALTAAFEVWNRRSEQKSNANDMASAMAGNARGKEAFELNGTLADSRKLSKEALTQNIEEMEKALEAAGSYTKELKEQVKATNDLTKKYDVLKDAIGDVANKFEEQKAAQEAMLQDAWDAGGSLISDNMLEDTQEFDAAMAEYQKKLTIASKQIKGILSEWLKNQGQFKEEFASMTGKQIFEALSDDIQESFLNYAWNAKGIDNVTQNMLRDVSSAYAKVNDKLSELKGDQGEEFASIMKAMYEEAFKVDLDKATDDQKIAFDKWLRETLSRAEKLSNDAREALRNITIDFTIKLVPNYQVVQPQTPEDVLNSDFGDNQWLGNFFRRNEKNYAILTPEAVKDISTRYKKVLGDISLSNLDVASDKINKQLDQLEDSNKELANSIEKGHLSEEEKNKLRDAKKKNEEDIDLLESALSDIGGTRKRKGDKKSGRGSGEDKNAKAVREQVRVMKEAADAFQYWREKVGVAGAWTHVQQEFGKVLDDINVTADNIEDLKANLERIKTTKAFQNIKDQKVKTEIEKEIAKEQDKLKRKDFERETEKFLSETQLELDNLTRSWETFNKVREATGDIDLAIQLSGANYRMGNMENLADALKKKIEDDFASAGAVMIPVDVSMSDEDIKRKVEEVFNKVAPVKPERQKGESDAEFTARQEAYNKALAEHEAKIKGITEETKKLRNVQRDMLSADVDVFAKLSGSLVDYKTRMSKLTEEYNKQIEALERLRALGIVGNPIGITQAQYTKGVNSAKATYKRKSIEELPDYQMLMDGIVTMTQKAATDIKQKYIDAINRELDEGKITAKEYAEKIKDINEKMDGLETSKLDKYLNRGLKDRVEYEKKEANSMIRQGAEMKKAGENMSEFGKAYGSLAAVFAGQNMTQNGAALATEGQNMLSAAQSMSQTVTVFTQVIGAIISFVQGVKAIQDEIDEMDAALGSHNTADDLHTFWNTASSSFGKLSQGVNSAMSGDFFGTFAGIVGFFTSWVTGFAKGHDAKREYQIQLSKKQLEVIQHIDERLDKQLERTLGGGVTATIDEKTKQQLAKYQQRVNDLLSKDTKVQAKAIMAERFSSSIETGNVRNFRPETIKAILTANENESVYSTQYSSLLMQRDQIQRQLDNERDKKDSDKMAIEEYEEKLGELNDQIQYFVEDIGKELYSLDLKGWADQIGDALMNAFENGEDAMKAFRDTAKDIVKDVASEMLKIGVIEPMMEKLRTKLFEEEWTDSNGNKMKGAYNETTGRWDEERTLSVLGEYFGEGGELEKSVEASEQFYEWIQKITGMDLSSEDKSSSTSTGIKSVTEQTADLLASYINAIRADVSVNRAMIAQYFPMYYAALTTGNDNLRNIEANTLSIVRSNDLIAQKITSLDNNITGLKNRSWKMPVA